ncbi:MAG: MarR family transcriptional regulator [Chitinophagaceae bacterium]|nr:MarR family transcriptional regulator [Chitinophagaceae bacterium]
MTTEAKKLTDSPGMKACESRYKQCLYFASSALSRKVEKLATECWQPAGLGPSHGYLLMVVIDEPGVQPSMLVEQLHLTPSTITRLIEKLEEKKLVVRTTEGKLTNVYPTPKGKDMLPLLKSCVQTFYQRSAAMLGHNDMQQLVGNICQMTDQLEV